MTFIHLDLFDPRSFASRISDVIFRNPFTGLQSTSVQKEHVLLSTGASLSVLYDRMKQI